VVCLRDRFRLSLFVLIGLSHKILGDDFIAIVAFVSAKEACGQSKSD